MSLRYEREQAEAIRAVRQAAALCRAVAGGDQPGGAGQEGQEPGHGGRLRQPGAHLPGPRRRRSPTTRSSPRKTRPSCGSRRTPALLDQVVDHVGALDLAGAARLATARGLRLDRPGRHERVPRPVLDRSTRSTAPRASSATSSTPSRWRSSSTAGSWSRPWRARTCRSRPVPGRAGQGVDLHRRARAGGVRPAAGSRRRRIPEHSDPSGSATQDEAGRGPVLRVGRVGPQRPRRRGGDRGAARDRRAAGPDGQPGEVRGRRAGRGRDLPPHAHPGRLSREDLGPRRRCA